MIEKIVAPAAAVIGTAAAAMAGATIALILTIPTGRAVASTGSDVVFPFLEAALRMLGDAFWSVLQNL
jgi:hypothetical protein